jgi:Flp pilus assembly protein TadB
MTTPGMARTQMDLGAAEDVARTAENLATKKIWLPKVLYDSLPWFYLLAGVAAFFATLYVSTWLWVVPHYVLFSLACVHLGIAVMRKRRRARRERDAS